jgi:hypothetical protein
MPIDTFPVEGEEMFDAASDTQRCDSAITRTLTAKRRQVFAD